MRVLVVDDNATSRSILQEMLESFSFKVSMVASGEEGITELENADEEWDLKNEIVEYSNQKSAIRNLQSAIKGVPIIAMTAHAMAGDEQKSIEAGMNDHVTKPIDLDQLFAALQQWIQPSEKRVHLQPLEVSADLPDTEPHRTIGRRL